jgi:hypothetical protein
MYITKKKTYSTSQKDIKYLKTNLKSFLFNKKKEDSKLFKEPSFYSPTYLNYQFETIKSPIQSEKNLISEYSTSLNYLSNEKSNSNYSLFNNNFSNFNTISNVNSISNNYNIIYHKKSNSNKFNTINNISRITLSPVNNRKKLSKEDLNFYKNIFKEKPIFKSKPKLINNTLNLLYSENEKIFEEKIDMENLKMISENKQIKFSKRYKNTENLLKTLKDKIKFIKAVTDYSYPGIIIHKIKSLRKELENQKEKREKKYFSPVNKRIKEFNLKEKVRKNVLSNCISIYKFKKLKINK